MGLAHNQTSPPVGMPPTPDNGDQSPVLHAAPVHLTSGPLDPNMFPDRPRPGTSAVPGTIANFAYLLDHYQIHVRFNVIKKRVEIHIPDLEVTPQNRDNVTHMHLVSLAAKHGLPRACADDYMLSIADRYPCNPMAEWVSSQKWDGVDRRPQICATVTTEAEFPVWFRDVLMHKWLLSVVAATFKPTGYRGRGVLTFQGPQGLGKTSWFKGLISHPELRDEMIKLGHHWDGGSKDAKLTALRHLIVELGELEGSFRKDNASLKSFITEDWDKIRPPYARMDNEYPRQTVFGASVNEREFLQDATGNSRFWTLPVVHIDYDHDVDMQQLFAQLKVELDEGGQWWLTPEEEAQLTELNQHHRAMSAVGEKVRAVLDLTRKDQSDLQRMSAAQVLGVIRIDRPTNAQFKECNAVLRECLGESKRINGVNKWRVPLIIPDEGGLKPMSPRNEPNDTF